MSTIKILLLIASFTFSINVSFLEKPTNCQLFPRNELNMGEIKIVGTLRDLDFDSLSVTVTRNNRLYSRFVAPAVYRNDTADFVFHIQIPAELAEYAIILRADTVLIIKADSLVAGDAFVINGQSNAVTMDPGKSHDFVRTWSLTQGKWIVSSEGVWGQELAYKINCQQGVPVAIINGAESSMGLDVFLKGTKNYNNVLSRATQSGLRNYIKAVLWYQGEADCNAGSLPTYASHFHDLYMAWQNDYPAIKRVYVFQINGNCYGTGGVLFDQPYARNIREIQRNLPKTCPNVRLMASSGTPDYWGHYGIIGYQLLADKIFPLVARDLYSGIDTVAITPPNLLRAYFSSATKDRVTLQFDQPVYWTNDTLGKRMADYFALDSVYQQVDSGWQELEYHRIVLKLKTPSNASKISYLTGGFYLNTSSWYQGPFLFNSRRVGALTFHEAPIEQPLFTDTSVAIALDLTSSKSSLLQFESAQLYAAVTHGGGWIDTNKSVAFRSLDTFVVQVGATGLMRAFNSGTGRIVATRDKKADTLIVTVGPSITTIAGLAFTAKARTVLQGDSMPASLTALLVEGGDTLRFSMDTIATITTKSSKLRLHAGFVTALEAGENLLLKAEAAGFRCSTLVTVKSMPSFLKRINFQSVSAEQTQISGWVIDNGTAYSATRRLGWVSLSSGMDGGLSTNEEPNYFKNTFICPRTNTEQTFRVDAPAGNYWLRLYNYNRDNCSGKSYIRYGTDTLLMNRACSYSNHTWGKSIDKQIVLVGDSGLVLKVSGAICYMVLMADEGTDLYLVAKDQTAADYVMQSTKSEKIFYTKSNNNQDVPWVTPNPFNPSTVVRFSLPPEISAEYQIYNVRGQNVFLHKVKNMSKRFEQRIVVGGQQTKSWASGVYYGRLARSDGKYFTHKLMLIR